MSKSSQDEGAAESVAQDAPAGGPSKKTPADIYENPGGSKKIIRVFTVLAYMFSVSFVGILLSAYYVFLWQPPNPRLLHKAQIQAEPQYQFLVDTQPASLLSVANRTRDSDKIITSGEDHREAVQKAATFAQAPLKSNTRKFSFYPSPSIDRKHMNLNKSDDGSHRVKQDAGMAWRSSRAENLTESKHQSRVSLGNILQRSTVKIQTIKRTKETFNMVEFVKEKNESALPVTFLNNNDEIRRIKKIKVNFTNSDDFNSRSLENSSSPNLTFDQLDEPEESLNETEVNFPEDPQVDLPNPAHSQDNETTGPPDASPTEPKILTEATISTKLTEESTNDSYTENRTVSIYSTETLVNGTKTTESSRMDELTISSTESAQNVIPLQNDPKILRHPEDTTLTKTTSETISTFGTARTESEDSTENSQTTDKNR